MGKLEELLGRVIPFVVVPIAGIGDRIPASARGLRYLHELEIEELDLEEVNNFG
ncbi:MAG: hypothetical protein ABIH69_04555 [bacterium]